MIFLPLIILSYLPTDTTIVDFVDVIEVNHVYQPDGIQRGDFLLFWEWKSASLSGDMQLKIVDWVSLEKEYYRETLTPAEYRKKQEEYNKEWADKYGKKWIAPPYNPEFIGGAKCPRRSGEYYVVVFWDKRVMRKVYAHSIRETWTQYDPENDNQDWFPKDTRRGLTPPKSIKSARVVSISVFLVSGE